MLQIDSNVESGNKFFSNIHSISIESILNIQKDLEPYDMISLVFLLYDTPDTALQRLIVYERICKDVDDNNMNLLYEWALHAQTRPTWKYEFLEALTICKLHMIIRKLGFNVSEVKKHYLPDNVYVNVYINPIKKVLYKLCENISSSNFHKLKKRLNLCEIKLPNHETCELLFLELMCHKFIEISPFDVQTCLYVQISNIEKLASIIEYFDDLRQYSVYLKEIEHQMNNKTKLNKPKSAEIVKTKIDTGVSHPENSECDMQNFFEDFDDLYLDDTNIEFFKSDTKFMSMDRYPIKNKKRIGVCCIINQECFELSSTLSYNQEKLENRHGSSVDLLSLENTMSALNFKVISKSNLNHKDTFSFIKYVTQHIVQSSDSVFMLCILSHGVRGHIYAADSVKIKVQDIQNILDADEAVNLHGIPKVMILQACQVDEEPSHKKIALVADGPYANFYLKKSHFLIYWATAPEYEAFRHERGGTLFIQCLCSFLKKIGKSEQLSDIFTKVTHRITAACTKIRKIQVPIFESTLSKKLYLYCPE